MFFIYSLEESDVATVICILYKVSNLINIFKKSTTLRCSCGINHTNLSLDFILCLIDARDKSSCHKLFCCDQLISRLQVIIQDNGAMYTYNDDIILNKVTRALV